MVQVNKKRESVFSPPPRGRYRRALVIVLVLASPDFVAVLCVR